uniref:Uncharacterized protein n=1 Tax=Arundo donax TaxID=35708 RepID=A0A0A9C5L4_ARUDO
MTENQHAICQHQSYFICLGLKHAY